MAGVENRVATTGGATVRGYELNVTGGRPQETALLAFKAQIGGDAALQAAREQFEFRLVSRGSQKFLQLREKTTFGALKALFSASARERQATERRDAATLVNALMPNRPVVQRMAAQGLRPLQPAAAAPRPPAAPPAPALQPLFNPRNQQLQRLPVPVQPDQMAARPAPAAPPPISPAPAAPAPVAPVVAPTVVQAPSPAKVAKAAPAVQSSTIEKPKMLLKWEMVASRKNAVELHETLTPSELFRKLGSGEITERTYLDVLKLKKDRGQLNEADFRFHTNHGIQLPDQSGITIEKQRAVYVRDQLQAELFGDLKPNFLFRLVNAGEISERAYTLALKKQLREKRIDQQAFDVWKNPSVPGTVQERNARKLAEVDLAMQILFRKQENHARWIYKDLPLGELAAKLRSGALADYTYDAILQSQKRRGMIDDLDVALWRNG